MWIDRSGTTVLPPSECKRLLAVAAAEGGVGRLGIPTGQAPVVMPVNFSLRDGQVVVRTGPGFLAREAADRLVAFEVDHIDAHTSVAWSVLVRGLATLTESPTRTDLDEAPDPLVPVPGDMLLVVRPDVVTGRQFELRQTG
jgi:Pyridoxamine 5'-phosphate oxidase